MTGIHVNSSNTNLGSFFSHVSSKEDFHAQINSLAHEDCAEHRSFADVQPLSQNHGLPRADWNRLKSLFYFYAEQILFSYEPLKKSGYKQAPKRILSALIGHMERRDSSFMTDISQESIALELGITRRTVNAAMRQLKNLGLIKIIKRGEHHTDTKELVGLYRIRDLLLQPGALNSDKRYHQAFFDLQIDESEVEIKTIIENFREQHNKIEEIKAAASRRRTQFRQETKKTEAPFSRGGNSQGEIFALEYLDINLIHKNKHTLQEDDVEFENLRLRKQKFRNPHLDESGLSDLKSEKADETVKIICKREGLSAAQAAKVKENLPQAAKAVSRVGYLRAMCRGVRDGTWKLRPREGYKSSSGHFGGKVMSRHRSDEEADRRPIKPLVTGESMKAQHDAECEIEKEAIASLKAQGVKFPVMRDDTDPGDHLDAMNRYYSQLEYEKKVARLKLGKRADG